MITAATFWLQVNRIIFQLNHRHRIQNIAAFCLGSLLTLTLAPFHWWWMACIAFPGFLMLLHEVNSRAQALLRGWWFGFGHFVTSLYWISIALTIDLSQFGWLIPFAVIGINGVLAGYIALVALFLHQLPRCAWVRILSLVIIWCGMEWIRRYAFSGFPWNLLGYAWAETLPMAQLASLTGVYGLSLLLLWIGSLPYYLLRLGLDGCKVKWCQLCPLIVTCISLMIAGGWGWLRLKQIENMPPTSLLVRVIQPNIPQDHKWQPDRLRQNVETQLRLTQLKTGKEPQIIIWPEAAFPYFLNQEAALLQYVRNHLPKESWLIAGGVRLEGTQIWNSLYALYSEKSWMLFYDKHHLVPFGEYIPLRAWLPFKKITEGNVDFSEGKGPQRLVLSPHIPSLLPFICYEAIFPEYAKVAERAGWLLNITNDAWFGKSSGPYQHAVMVKFRAIEQGLPMVRSANTGISFVTDSSGRFLRYLSLNETGMIETLLPQPLKPTVYATYGNLIPFLLWVILVIAVGVRIYCYQRSLKG